MIQETFLIYHTLIVKIQQDMLMTILENAVTIDAFLSSVKRITPEQLQSLKIERLQSEFSDGPPCLESLTRRKT